MELGVEIWGLRFLTGDLSTMRLITGHYDPLFIAGSVACAFFGAFIGLTVSQFICTSRQIWENSLWFVAGTISVAAAFWTMHYLTLVAYKLPVESGLHREMILASALPALLAGFAFMWKYCTRSSRRILDLLTSGMLALGILAMQVMGIEAIWAIASFGYDPTTFAVSVLVAMLLSYLALKVRSCMSWLALPGSLGQSSVLAALIAGIALSASYFFASATVFVHEGSDSAFFYGEIVRRNFLQHLHVDLLLALALSTLLAAYARRKYRMSSLFESFLRTSLDGFIVINHAGEITLFNPSAEGIFGYTSEEAIGASVDMLVPPEHRQGHRSSINSYRPGRTSEVVGKTRELTGLRKDGTRIAIELSISEITLGRDCMFTASVRDITQRLELQRAKEEAHIETVQSLNQQVELNELQRQFVAMASHEFRTPLTTIDLCAQRLLRKKKHKNPDFLETSSVKIRSSVKRLIRMIDSILSYEKVEAGTLSIEKTECDISAIIRDVCERHQDIYNTHRIDLSIGGLPPTISADLSALDHILSNLISNAVKYSPGRSRIEVYAALNSASGMILFSVRDFGVGIPADQQDKIFDRYYRASTSSGTAGTGLGLHLSKLFTELHGGRLHFKSVEGEGSLFVMELPVEDVDTGVTGKPLEPAPRSELSGGISFPRATA